MARHRTRATQPTSPGRSSGKRWILAEYYEWALKQQIDTTTPTGRLVFHLLGAIDEFQRELIVEGTREGLDAARPRGRTGGRKPKLSAAKAATVRRMYQATGPDGKRLHTVAEIAQTVGVHRTTVYDYLKREG